MSNLWNLKDIDGKVANSPNLILEEQAKYFEKNVKDVLYARITNVKLTGDEGEYKLATNFSIVSPTLDNYTFTLFTLYSNPESIYPVAIGVNDNKDNIDVKYICNNEKEFIDKLSEILRSEKITEIIAVLYSKSRNF